MFKKTAVIALNLGTPDHATKKSVKKYLLEFLSDRRIIKRQGLLWQIILRGIILNIRPKKSAKNYQSIFREDGVSPLLHYTKTIADRLSHELDMNVIPAMRYGNPSIKSALDYLHHKKYNKVIILPLYPQFSFTTTLSCFDKVYEYYKKKPYMPELSFLTEYYQNKQYINAVADSIKQKWKNNKADKLVISFHGIPKSYVRDGDPYYDQAMLTGKNIVNALSLTDDEYVITFQSRFGPEKWLQPYTDKTLEYLAKNGVNSVDVVCPGFSCDCLETLEEIEEENKDIFLKSGGKQYNYINCLNDCDAAIDLYKNMIAEYL